MINKSVTIAERLLFKRRYWVTLSQCQGYRKTRGSIEGGIVSVVFASAHMIMHKQIMFRALCFVLVHSRIVSTNTAHAFSIFVELNLSPAKRKSRINRSASIALQANPPSKPSSLMHTKKQPYEIGARCFGCRPQALRS